MFFHAACCCGTTPCTGTLGGYTPPAMNVTLSWTDADTTKSWRGLTFTNGETKQVCPDFYTCNGTGYATSFQEETWGYGPNDPPTVQQDSGIWMKAPINPGYTQSSTLRQGRLVALYIGSGAYGDGVWVGHRQGSNTTSNSAVTNSTDNIVASNLGNVFINDAYFGQFTTTGGETLQWARGAGTWNPCGAA